MKEVEKYKKSRKILGYICYACTALTILVPSISTAFLPTEWDVKHKFWLAWEGTGIAVTIIFTIVFWIYEFFLDNTPLPGNISAFCSVLVLVGCGCMVKAAVTALNHGLAVHQVLWLVGGAVLWALNSFLVWQHHKKSVEENNAETILNQVEANDSSRRYEACFKSSDLPALCVFVVLFIFIVALPDAPICAKWYEHREDEVHAFLAGVVVFQFMVSNIAYAIEFSPLEISGNIFKLNLEISKSLSKDDANKDKI